MAARAMVLCLTGDVMTGRGVDQILPTPSDPHLSEGYVKDARTYVELAEAVAGPIPQPVDFAWPWGEALEVLDEMAPDVRVINLETSVTRSDDLQASKAVHYRMHPDNVACLTAARPDACVLANNHVLDFGVRGLEETLDTLTQAGLRPVGAGRSQEQAWRPARVDADGAQVLVWSVAEESCGVPPSWAAGDDRSGIAFLSDLSDASAADLGQRVRGLKRPGDLAVVSIHWGSNWGYDVPHAHVRFAHRLIDSGVDLVHGHSSHHPRPIEVYRERLVLYGCGDLIDDYEGIHGYEQYRNDLRLLYFATFDPSTCDLQELRMVPMKASKMRLRRATASDARWLRGTVDRISQPFGAQVELEPDDSLTLRPA